MALDALASAQPDVAIEAGYLAIRALKHRSGSAVAVDRPFGTQSDEALVLANEIILEITTAEKRPVADLGRVQVEYYINRISDVLSGFVRTDSKLGEAVLSELRSQFA